MTTVGYGDLTPKEPSGRLVATFVMLAGIAFLTIAIAAITSTFVARAEREREAGEAADEDRVIREDRVELRIDSRLDELSERLERVESILPLACDG